MRLLPREADRLQIFLAAELARRRRARGLRLGQAEAAALIADEVCEAARDGVEYAAAVARGYAALGPEDVLDDVGRLLPGVEVEALFADGSRLVVLEDPIGRSGPPPPAHLEVPWGPSTVTIEVVNEGDVVVGLTSHFHVFEANRALRFDRAAAWGMRLDVPAGVKVFFDPGRPVTVRLRRFGGARVIRGHGGLVDGALDAPGVRETALRLARERGYRGA
jgi:urease subunit gamma/beta